MQAHLAEYQAMRAEIERRANSQHLYTNYAMAFLGAITTAMGFSKDNPNIAIVFLVAPIFFSILGILFLREAIIIMKIGNYIHNGIRPNVIRLLISDDIWKWEFFYFEEKLIKRLIVSALNRARWLVFVIPSIISLAFYHLVPKQTAIRHEDVLYIISVLVIIFNIILALSERFVVRINLKTGSSA